MKTIKFEKQSNFKPPKKKIPGRNPYLRWEITPGNSIRVGNMSMQQLKNGLEFAKQLPQGGGYLAINNARWVEVFTAEIEYRGTYAQHES